MRNLINKIKNYNYRRIPRLAIAYAWKYIYWFRNYLYMFKVKHGNKIAITSVILLLLFIGLLIQFYHYPITLYFSNIKHFSELKSLYITLGGVLIGSSAIVFTLVLFAMQVNVERMPYGLFHKLASDPRLLGVFFTTFLLALFVISLGLTPEAIWVPYTLILASGSVLLIMVLFIYAYRRALNLISPTQQLIYVFQNVKYNFLIRDKSIKRTMLFFESPSNKNNDRNEKTDHDVPRMVYFKKFPSWTDVAKKAIFYCNSYARRYAEKGDLILPRKNGHFTKLPFVPQN